MDSVPAREPVSEGMEMISREILKISQVADVATVQAIVIQNGTVWASADSRKNGIAAAY